MRTRLGGVPMLKMSPEMAVGQRRRRFLLGLAACWAILFLMNCGRDLPMSPQPEVGGSASAKAVETVAIVSGDAQTGVVNTLLPARLVVRVTKNGQRVRNETVAFAVTTGGGTLSATTATTDMQGNASVALTLGKVAGAVAVTATIPGPASVVFHETATPGAAAKLNKISGDAQTGVAGTQLAQPLVVELRDAFDNLIAGATVTFTVLTGGGSISAPPVTDADGRISARWTLGNGAGPNTANATIGAVTPAAFSATGNAGAAAKFTIKTGDGQTGTVATLLPIPLAVLVADAHDNPVAGVQVTFDGTPKPSPTNVTTGSDGVAQTTYTLGTKAGPLTVTASAPGLTTLSFTETATAGPASIITIVSGNGQSAVAGQAVPLPLVVGITDAYGNIPAPTQVTYQVIAGGGSTSAPSVLSDAAGHAQVTWMLGSVGEANTVNASIVGASPVTFTATATTPYVVVIVSGDGQSAVVGHPLALPLVVRVQFPDEKTVPGAPIVGAAVAFSVVDGGGTLTTLNAVTGSDGTASTALTVGASAGFNHVSATATGASTAVLFTASGVVPGPTTVVKVSGDGQSGPWGTTLTDPVVVKVVDGNGNGFPGATVTFAPQPFLGIVTGVPVDVVTDANGVAQFAWRLAELPVDLQLRVSSGVLAPLTFTAHAVPLFAAFAGDNQTAGVGQPISVSVRLQHGDGSAIQGVPITFDVTIGGGSISNTVATNSSGVATATWTLGVNPGPQQARARLCQGICATYVVFFNATALAAGAPTTLAIESGNQQFGGVGLPLQNDLVVRATDANGIGVGDVSVAFAVTQGGGSLSSPSVVTDASGRARVSLTLGGSTGTNTVTAAASGLNPVTFTETALAASTMIALSGDGAVGVAGTRLRQPLVVQLSNGRDVVPGETVEFSVLSGGATLDATTVVTDAAGDASTTLTLGAPGPIVVRAAYAGTFAVQDFSITSVAAGPYGLQLVTGGGLGIVSTPSPVGVRVTDANGDGVAGATVQFNVTTGGGSFSPTSAQTDETGLAGSDWTLGPTPGFQTAAMSVPGTALSTKVTIGASPRLEITFGDGQVGTPGQPAPVPLVVTARDGNGAPAAGMPVLFAVLTGGGSVTPSGFTTTNVNGQTGRTFTLGPNLVENTIRATSGASSVTFTVTGVTAGPAASLSIVSGDGQRSATNAPLPDPLVVLVHDANGLAVANVTVDFSVASGGGSITASALTDAAGHASATWTLGTAGPNTARASIGGVTPVDFTANAVAPASLMIVGGDGQRGEVGTSLGQLQVTVLDAAGAELPGALVRFTALTAGGSIAPASVVADRNGLAGASPTLGTVAGTYTYRAEVSGIPAVLFSLEASPGQATVISIVSGDGQSGQVATQLADPLIARITDQYGNVKPGVTVSFGLPVDAELLFASPTAGGDGLVSAGVRLGFTAGQQIFTFSAGNAQAHFTENAVAAAPANIATYSGDHQSGTVGTTLAAPLVVRVTDIYGNAAPGASVAFASADPSGAVSPGSSVSDAAGLAYASATLGTRAVLYFYDATFNGQTVQFSATATAGSAVAVRVVSGDGQAGTVGTQLPQPLRAQAVDAYGNGVPRITVMFTGPPTTVFAPAMVESDGGGYVHTVVQLPDTAGPLQIDASATDVTSARFNVLATPDAPFQLRIVSGNNQTGQVSKPLADPLVARVVDRFGNGIRGAVVSFQSLSGGAVSPPTAITDATGAAQTTGILGPQSGPQAFGVSFGALAPVIFSANAVP